MKKMHFISGLPRAGTTMLAGILMQNPRFSAGMSSPLGGILNGVVKAMGPENEFAIFLDDEKRKRMIEATFEAYFADQPEAEVVFDTNRSWTTHLGLIKKISPNAKIIACVRSPAWVFDSIEQLVRKNAFQHSKMFNQNERSTVYSRADAIIGPNRLLGYSLNALKEAYFGADADQLLVVEYETLCRNPKEAIGLIYKFIGEEPYEHDFENVEFSADEFDTMMGTPGLHQVKRRVAFTPRETILPPDIFKRFDNLAFWRDMSRSKAFRIVAESESNAPGVRKVIS